VTAVDMTPRGPVVAEDVRDLQSWTVHVDPLCRTEVSSITSPSRSTTQIAVASIRTSNPAKYSMAVLLWRLGRVRDPVSAPSLWRTARLSVQGHRSPADRFRLARGISGMDAGRRKG
jgi:hypothetical protein